MADSRETRTPRLEEKQTATASSESVHDSSESRQHEDSACVVKKKRAAKADRPQTPVKIKRAKEDAPASEKKPLFHRLWSVEDEVVLLEGLRSFNSKENGNGASSAFYDFIKTDLPDYTKAQVDGKLRKLMRKYLKSVDQPKKLKNDGHARKMQDLSRSIWGTKTRVSQSKDERIDISRVVHYGNSSNDGLSLSFDIEKVGLELVEGSEREEVQRRWDTLKVNELEVLALRTGMFHHEATRVLQSLKRS